MAELDIWLDGQLSATTLPRSKKRRSLTYTPGVVDRYGDEAAVLSCSLPTPGPAEPAKTHSFLEGLLPEGQALDAMAARVRDVRLTVNGVPESADDVVALLAEYGRECAGAVVVVPHGQLYRPDAGAYERLDAGGLAAVVQNLPEHPLGSDPAREIRMSLAGAQPKFLLARFDGQWYEPINGAASTHILKPTTKWAGSANNEALVMSVARDVGLTPAECWVETVGTTTVFVAQRYDRVIVAAGEVRRRHQEDMCQAAGLRPSQKYDIGRPSQRMARVLREQTIDPRTEVMKLFRQIAFRAIVGDEDGHGKNYSLCIDAGVVTLAPLYDSLCTLVYPELSGKLGAPVGRQQNLARVDRDALIEEAVAMGIPGPLAREALDDLAGRIDDAVDGVPPTLTNGWDSEPVMETIRSRLTRLRADEPMGLRDRKTSPRTRTLDELTR